MLAPCAVLDEAHDEAVTFLGLNDYGRDLRLAQLNKGFDPTLTANKIVACGVSFAFTRANRDRTLKPDVGNALNDLLEVSLISSSRIQKAYLINGNGLYALWSSRFRRI